MVDEAKETGKRNIYIFWARGMEGSTVGVWTKSNKHHYRPVLYCSCNHPLDRASRLPGVDKNMFADEGVTYWEMGRAIRDEEPSCPPPRE